ncbi:MAG: hypothetical protein EZS28_041481 [Streblomastix strix]|uniref:Uncharacterized protein n=1 Tax=Streblomastix strix TaxID=222440 RepID=A0A5J4TZ12_9EUKA|nr:MAG: hypothetical protein EZS28_041481 [Streblomastix strix]
MLLNEDVDILIQKKAWELLDALYPEGIKLPPKYQTETVRLFCSQLKVDDDNIKQEALRSASFLAVNKENHSDIIAGGGIDIAVGNINLEDEDVLPEEVKACNQMEKTIVLLITIKVKSLNVKKEMKKKFTGSKMGSKMEKQIEELMEILK